MQLVPKEQRLIRQVATVQDEVMRRVSEYVRVGMHRLLVDHKSTRIW